MLVLLRVLFQQLPRLSLHPLLCRHERAVYLRPSAMMQVRNELLRTEFSK